MKPSAHRRADEAGQRARTTRFESDGMSMRIGHESAVAAEVVPRRGRVDGFGALDDEWNALAERSGGIFSTALWSRLWWEHFGGERELAPACGALDRRRAAARPPALRLAPPHRRASSASSVTGPATSSAPLRERGDHELAADTHFASALDELDWDVFLGEQLPATRAGSSSSAAARGGAKRARPCSFRDSWDEYLGGAERELPAAAPAPRGCTRTGGRRRDCGSPSDATLDGDLDALFALHRARWGSDVEPTSTTRRSTASSRARRSGGAGCGSGCSSSTAARSPPGTASRSARLRATTRRAAIRHTIALVGFLLMAHSIRSAIAEGATEYRFGRGDEAFKAQVRERRSRARDGRAEPRRGRRGSRMRPDGRFDSPVVSAAERAQTGS